MSTYITNMRGNRYKENFNSKETRSKVMTYDWRTAGVIQKLFNQLSINVGLEKWKYRTHEAAFKEAKQLHQR